MLLKKYIKNRKKLKILLLLSILGLIVITIIILNTKQNGSIERLLDERFIARAKLEQPPILLKSPQDGNGNILPEKYDEHVKARLMQDKIRHLRQNSAAAVDVDEYEHASLDAVTTGVHIFYTAPVQWYKSKKTHNTHVIAVKETLTDDDTTDTAVAVPTTIKPVRVLNTAFYPAMGLYKPTASVLQQHFENIRKCGVGVLILSYTGKSGEEELYQQILDLVPSYNLSVSFEISVAGNQSMEYLRQQLLAIQRFSTADGFYRVKSMTRKKMVPLLYVSNAYKLSEMPGRALCGGNAQPDSLRRIIDAYFIGHIRLKNHADIMRRLCFEGYYSKLPSNGATFASTWKNWSYLKSFALTYKMLFVPTVGPGFAERNKFPRHGDIQRHRSNGRYYGVAWRTAIINHVGFINIASYNNWPDGSQIEEVVPMAGFLDYNPGAKTKYIDLTAHWVANFLKTRYESAAGAVNGQLSCYEFLNNTIC